MEKLAICRICLDNNVQVNIENTHLQEIYERLTATQFQTSDMRPLALCYICHGQLNAARRLMVKCLKAEEILTEMLSQLMTVTHAVPNLTVIHRSALNPMCFTEIQQISIDGAEQDVGVLKVKKEVQIEYDINVKTEELSVQDLPETSYGTDSESDSERCLSDTGDDVPLNEVKIERDTGELDLKKLKKAAPNAKMPDAVVNTPTKGEIGEASTRKFNYDVNISDLYDEIDVKEKKDIKMMSDITVGNANAACSKSSLKKIHKIDSNCGQGSFVEYGIMKRRVDNDITCDVCKKCFNQKSQLVSHMRTHTRGNSHVYDVSMKRLTKRRYVKSQSRVPNVEKTDEKPQVCNICQKILKNKYCLKAHLLLHTGKRYACDVCPKRYNRKDSLIIHTRTHTGEKPYVCDVCNKGFPDKSHYTTHKRMHGDSPYVCDICGNSFTSKNSLIQHTITHTGEKPYTCDVCHKGFTQKCYLKIHSRLHTGDKPYVCDTCGKGFCQKSSFHAHERLHSGIKPYACELCEKKFTTRNALTRHTRIHTGEKYRSNGDAISTPHCGNFFDAYLTSAIVVAGSSKYLSCPTI